MQTCNNAPLGRDSEVTRCLIKARHDLQIASVVYLLKAVVRGY